MTPGEPVEKVVWRELFRLDPLRFGRNRKFADSSLEEEGFELSVPLRGIGGIPTRYDAHFGDVAPAAVEGTGETERPLVGFDGRAPYGAMSTDVVGTLFWEPGPAIRDQAIGILLGHL